jgi:hypothetical protein
MIHISRLTLTLRDKLNAGLGETDSQYPVPQDVDIPLPRNNPITAVEQPVEWLGRVNHFNPRIKILCQKHSLHNTSIYFLEHKYLLSVKGLHPANPSSTTTLEAQYSKPAELHISLKRN